MSFGIYVVEENGLVEIRIATEEELKELLNNGTDEGEYPDVVSVIQLDQPGEPTQITPGFHGLVELLRSAGDNSDHFLEKLLTRVWEDGRQHSQA